MQWGCSSAAGLDEKLAGTEEQRSTVMYKDILDQNQNALHLRLGRWSITLQGTGPPHRAKISKRWLQDNCVNVLEQPAGAHTGI